MAVVPPTRLTATGAMGREAVVALRRGALDGFACGLIVGTLDNSAFAAVEPESCGVDAVEGASLIVGTWLLAVPVTDCRATEDFDGCTPWLVVERVAGELLGATLAT